MTSLDAPNKVIAQPGGYFMAPVEEERIGDVSNVLFSNGGLQMKTERSTSIMLLQIHGCM